MRIAFITDTYLPEVNGVTASTSVFAEELAKRGHDMLVLAPQYPKHRDTKDSDVDVRRYRSGTVAANRESRAAFPTMPQVAHTLADFAPDVVHLHTPFGIGLAGLAAAERLGVPNVQTYHSFLPGMAAYWLNSGRLARFDRRALRLRRFRSRAVDEAAETFTRLVYGRADLVVAPSHYMCNMLRAIGVDTRIEYLTNGLDLTEFEPKTDYTPTGTILHTGRLGHEKNVDIVVRAFALLAEERPDVSLRIMGVGPAESGLRVLVAAHRLGDRVRFDGWVSRATLARAYREADVYVTASNFETQGIVVLEAVASGLPVVAVDALAVPEMARVGEQSILVPPFDPASMAEALALIMRDRELRERLGKAGPPYVAREHDKRDAVVRLEGLYESLLADPA